MRYDELLVKTAVPERPRFLDKKWLRYYLDSCHKYRFEPSKSENLSGFLNKLKDKKQNKDQQKQAAHAISIINARTKTRTSCSDQGRRKF